jgi:hypothetical protein
MVNEIFDDVTATICFTIRTSVKAGDIIDGVRGHG